jgi:hypothetical protein
LNLFGVIVTGCVGISAVDSSYGIRIPFKSDKNSFYKCVFL